MLQNYWCSKEGWNRLFATKMQRNLQLFST